ncbi:MAG: alpha-N-arabinofuranosidase, partial [Oscillospiraceae bacterium]|nr:alpha-N-arabinofuranosidase [Oscillospiraceae bacterium]
VEEGTNPGFLYQQNTMRDAVVAACNLNIFNRHSDRVVMANLAQAVNVLQSLVLTDGKNMVLTPTYHVFDLFKSHQGGEAVYCHTENQTVGKGAEIPMVSCSASVKDGKLTVTLANCSIEDEADVDISLLGFTASSAEARIVTGECHALNDFDSPENVVPEAFSVTVGENGISADVPPCSVVSVILS